MSYRLLRQEDAFWRESNQMGVLNTDIGRQLEATHLGVRLWRMKPGQASTNHRHRTTEEIYILLEGTGKLRVDDELLVLNPMDSVAVDPTSVRQPFNDTDSDQLWLIFGAPNEVASTLELSAEDIEWMYPDGLKAMPAELS